jgi:tetraacyldisaccharide 4'-kinase
MFDKIWWETISKKKKNPGDMLLMAVLYIMSFFYGLGLAARNFMYNRGILKPAMPGDRIISVGNITVGGTGKTPFTEELGRRIVKSGRRLMIAAKGYKRKKISDVDVVSNGAGVLLRPKNAGDEPYMLARNIKEASVVVGSDKARAIEYGMSVFKPDIVLLDDGFQKRKLFKKAQNVVLIDAVNPFGFNRLFPAGMLREPVQSLREADAVVITNTNLVDDPGKVAGIREYILKVDKKAAIFEAEIQPKFFYNVFTGEKAGTDFLNGKKVICFSAIGSPLGFERTLRMLGAHIIVGLRFRDHHVLRKKEAEAMCRLLDKTKASLLVTTEKDEVKLRRKHFTSDAVYALKTGMLVKNIKELDKILRLDK